MTVAARDVLTRLAAVGARIERQGGRLLLRVGPRPVPPPLIEDARSVKPELLNLLTRSADQHRRSPGVIGAQIGPIDAQLQKNEHLWAEASDSAAETGGIRHRCSSPGKVSTYGADEHLWGEAEDERAAIVEHDGGAPREWAEGFARLDPDRPPAGIPPRRWLQFVDDTGSFLDRWAAQASGLGWGPLDLFGCDRVRPFARIDKAGLLWLLHGNRLIALTADAAVIETRTGAKQTYCRKPTEPGRVLAWELRPSGPTASASTL